MKLLFCILSCLSVTTQLTFCAQHVSTTAEALAAIKYKEELKKNTVSIHSQSIQRDQARNRNNQKKSEQEKIEKK